MIKIIDNKKMGRSELGWLHSLFHFSFAEYFNPDNIQFGPLRVVNDDIIESQTGFDTHPHRDMEIVSYVVDGVLTHKDSMGNAHELERGQVQYMSAGTGIHHSEHNLTKGQSRFLQIWILPDKNGYKPNYGEYRFKWEEREGKWLHIVSGDNGEAPIRIHQDVNIYVLNLQPGQEETYLINEDRQVYLIHIEGDSSVNGSIMQERDAAEITDENKITLNAHTESHYILFDMKKSK